MEGTINIMKAHDLAKKLETFPPDCNVYYSYNDNLQAVNSAQGFELITKQGSHMFALLNDDGMGKIAVGDIVNFLMNMPLVSEVLTASPSQIADGSFTQFEVNDANFVDEKVVLS